MMQLNIKVKPARDMPSSWNTSLTLVYRPLIGLDGLLLYQILCAIADCGGQTSKEELCQLSGMGRIRLKKARELLEQYELVRSYVNEEGEIAQMELLPVRQVRQFLEHDLFGRMLFRQIGAQGLDSLKQLFDIRDDKPEEFKEVTARLDRTIIEEEWSDDQEQLLKAGLSNWHNPHEYDFNWGLFFDQMHRTIPMRLRTRENMSRIAYLASVYGLDEEAMRVLVIRNIKDNKTWIDFDAIVDKLGFTKKVKTGNPDDYSQAPVSFLQARQPGNTQVLPKERSLLLKLSSQHDFSNELINTIVEYSMEQCQGALVEKYVETLANNMARSGIETRDQALEYFIRSKKSASRSKKREKPSLPDWYDEIPQEKATKEELEEVLRLQNEILKGGNGDGKSGSEI